MLPIKLNLRYERNASIVPKTDIPLSMIFAATV